MAKKTGTMGISVDTYLTDTGLDIYLRLLDEVIKRLKVASKEIQ